MTIIVTQGDTQPLLTVTLFNERTKRTPLDLTQATKVEWLIKGGSAPRVVEASIADAEAGVTTWQWDGELGPRDYELWTKIYWQDGSIETSTEYQTLRVNRAAA